MIGIDIIEIDRIAHAVNHYGEQFTRRIYTDGERTYCLSKKKSEESFAARFAAKEAFGKAIGLGAGKAFAWRDVEVVRGTFGAPRVEVHGELKKMLERRGIDVARFHISLAHSGRDAIAVVTMK